MCKNEKHTTPEINNYNNLFYIILSIKLLQTINQCL